MVRRGRIPLDLLEDNWKSSSWEKEIDGERVREVKIGFTLVPSLLVQAGG